MDFSEEVRWHNPLSWMRSLPDRADFNRAGRQQRKTFPEIHMMKILEKQSGGKFKLEAPWGGVLDRVPCVDFNIVSLLEPDMVVAVRYDIVDSHNCYIRNIAPSKVGVPSEIVPPGPDFEFVLGEWMQVEGNPLLGRCGLCAVPLPTAVSTAQVISPGSEEAYGLQRILGAVALDDLFVFVAFLGNTGLTAMDRIQLQARRFTDNSLAWAASTSLITGAVTPGDQAFLSNLFWDLDGRYLNVVAENLVFTIHIPEGGSPDEYNITSVSNARYGFATVKDKALFFKGSGEFELRTFNTSKQWEVVETVSTSDLFTSAVVAPSPSYGTNRNRIRPWPFYTSKWYVVLTGTDSANLWGHGMVSVPVGGTAAKSRLFTTDQTTNTLSLETALAAGDLYHQFDADRPVSTEPGDTPPYEFPYWSAGEGGFAHCVWGGRRGYTALPPSGSGTTAWGWVYASVGWISGTVTYPVAAVQSYSWNCPRAVSNVRRDKTLLQAQWTEEVGDDPPVDSSGGVINSGGKLFYASIDPLRLVVPNPNILYYGTDVVTFDYTLPTCPSYYTFPDGTTSCTTGDPSDLSSYTTTRTSYHWPTSGYAHRTILHVVDVVSQAHTTLTLSNQFTGFSYNDVAMGSRFPVTLVEALPVPENVWEINIGPPTTWEGPDAYKDLVIILQDWRDNGDDQPRPCLTIVNATGDTVIARLKNLSNTDKIVDTDGEGDETFIAEEDQTEFILEYVPLTVTAVYLNSIPVSSGDYEISGESLIMGYPLSEGSELRVVYTYDGGEADVGAYVWQYSATKLATNFGEGENEQWAVVGVWSENLDGDFRNDLYIINLADPENPVVSTHLNETNTNTLPQPADFDRIVFAGGRVLYPGNSTAGWAWRELG